MKETKYETQEERILSDAQRLEIEIAAHEEIQAMYYDLQRSNALLRMRLALEVQGSAKISERYADLLCMVGNFIYSVRCSQADNDIELVQEFGKLEDHMNFNAPEVGYQIEAEHELLEAEIEAGEWADERMAELEEIIASLCTAIMSGDDPMELAAWEPAIEIARQTLDCEL